MVAITLPPINTTESSLQKRLKSAYKINPSELPESYRVNTSEEDSTLEYVDNFRKQFSQLYPQRANLFLCPKNECGIQKFVSTSIRPTKLPFKQLYDAEGCAKFVADYITYEPLVDPYKLPEYLQSPTSTMIWQAGNSFDMSTLLVSLLTGVGYDACCVYGYAAKRVTLNDQTQLECPYLVTEEKGDAAPAAETTTYYDKFVLKRPSLESQYLKKKQAASLSEQDGTKSSEKVSEEDDKERKLFPIHCWVLVLPHRRDVDRPYFIEPSTGQILHFNHPSLDSQYYAIETIWSNTNYWVNMQEVNIRDISYVLNDLTKWEFIFLDSKTKEEVSVNAKDENNLEVPSSWVSKIDLAKENFEAQYPGCTKITFYRKCKLELFTEYSRNDGMVRRITIYEDEKWTQVVEVREHFNNRKDYLLHRYSFPNEGKVHEVFAPGRPYDLKDLVYVKGVKTEMHFYPNTRSDGLIKRVVLVGKKVMEYYQSREDNKLVYRSATFDLVGNDDVTRISDGVKYYPLSKMTQKYDRSSNIPSDKDIEKLTFFVEQRKIEVTYHKDKNKIISSTRTYAKDGKTRGFQADAFARKPSQQELYDDYQSFLQIEKDCAQKLKDTDREATEVIDTREQEEKHIELKYSVYDTRKNKNKVVEEKKEEKPQEEAPKDYLSVFLNAALDGGRKQLTKEIVKHVVDNCIRSYKERLAQKEKLIQLRLEKETKQLKKKQSQFAKNQDMDKDEEEEHQKYINEATFRKRILEQRLQRQQTTANEMIERFDKKLRSDPRIAPFV